jgi:serine/threonine protein phosphatase PrpC
MESYQEGGKSLPPFGLFVLADGMGGHRSGEVASALAARAVVGHVTLQVHLRLLTDDQDPTDLSLDQILIEAVNEANAAVNSNVPGGGTTLTCMLMVEKHVHIAHVGDSRAYLVTENGLEQITRDHSLVDRLVEMGQITADEAARHPQKNVLYRAVGQGGAIDVDTYRRAIPPRGGLLLCSDGLWGMLSEENMARIINESYSPQAACEALVMAANEAGGRDNITAILVEPPIG